MSPTETRVYWIWNPKIGKFVREFEHGEVVRPEDEPDTRGSHPRCYCGLCGDWEPEPLCAPSDAPDAEDEEDEGVFSDDPMDSDTEVVFAF